MAKKKEASKATKIPIDEENEEISDGDDEKDIMGDDVIAGQVPKSHVWHDGDVEVEDLDGNITIISGLNMTGEERATHEAEVAEATVADPRFHEENIARRKIRYNSIFERGKAASKMADQSVLDFSDTWKGMAKLEKKVTALVTCKVGGYIDAVKSDGTPYIRQLSDSEIAALDSEARIGGTDELCECRICKARRDHAYLTAPATKLRSGKKIGWEKYGQGRTLG